MLGLACFVVYLTNLRFIGSSDSLPARLLPFSILREGNFDLDEFDWIRPSGFSAYYVHTDTRGRVWSTYPVVAPLLATPFAAPVVWWLRVHGVADDSVAFHLAALTVERLAAAAIAAASVSLLLLAACQVTTGGIALGAALAYAFGSNTWAISSQALWQHGPAELSLCGLSLCLLGRPGRNRVLSAGFWAALGTAARPSMIVFALLALLFVWRERRAWFWAFLLAPVLIGAALIAYNVTTAGRLTGGYGADRLALPALSRLAGLLVSPNRGLLVYTPAVLLALPAVLGRSLRPTPWLRYLAVGVAVYLVFMSGYVRWWGGDCWGPRFLTDVLPALALLGAVGAMRVVRTRVGRVFVLITIGWGVAMQVVGVYCDDRGWSQYPMSVDQHPERVWDWQDPQVLRALRSGWRGTDLAPILWQAIRTNEKAPLRPLDPSDLAGTITPLTALPEQLRAGEIREVPLRVENGGQKMWPAFSTLGPHRVEILQRWICGGALQTGVGGLSPLPRNLGPRQSEIIRILLEAPLVRGRCEVELFVDQRVGFDTGRWGGAALRFAVAVR